jgi:hypothetical protein
MIFTLNVETTPRTGNDLITLLEQCIKMVRYNIGPELIRSTKGPIYDAYQSDRIGTWAIDKDAGTTLADRATEKREMARIEAAEIRRLAKLAVGEEQ